MQVGLVFTALPHTLGGPQYPDNSEQAKVRFLVLEGEEVGANVIGVGLELLGKNVGTADGRDGARLGLTDGSTDGSGLGPIGENEGARDGVEGAIVGDIDGSFVGDNVGTAVGNFVGAFVLGGSDVW